MPARPHRQHRVNPLVDHVANAAAPQTMEHMTFETRSLASAPPCDPQRCLTAAQPKGLPVAMEHKRTVESPTHLRALDDLRERPDERDAMRIARLGSLTPRRHHPLAQIHVAPLQRRNLAFAP